MATWRERIAAARERGKFTIDEKFLACKWASCAIGEQHEMHPEVVKYTVGEGYQRPAPIDAELYLLGGGSRFNAAVECDDFDGAERDLDAIEDRVLQLKREATC